MTNQIWIQTMATDFINNDDDSLLLKQLRNDSKSAFDKLYQKYWKYVLNSTYVRIRDIDKAEDIAQDIFTKLWFRRGELSIHNLPAYLNTAVRNSVLTLMSKECRYIPINEKHLEIQSDYNNSDSEVLRKEFVRAYEELVNTLPVQQKTIFRMRYDSDLSTEEIALKVQLSPKTVRNHLGRALSTLRASLTTLLVMLIFLCK